MRRPSLEKLAAVATRSSIVLVSASLAVVLGCVIQTGTFPSGTDDGGNNGNPFNNGANNGNNGVVNNGANNGANNGGTNNGNNGATNNGTANNGTNNGTNNGNVFDCEQLCARLDSCDPTDPVVTEIFTDIECSVACESLNESQAPEDMTLLECLNAAACGSVGECFGTPWCIEECLAVSTCELGEFQPCLTACNATTEPAEPTCLQLAYASGECRDVAICLEAGGECVGFCDLVFERCVDENGAAPWPDWTSCWQACQELPRSESAEPADTFECRLSHLSDTATDAATACLEASATGTVCVGPRLECVEYCDLLETNCVNEQTVFGSREACLEACGLWTWDADEARGDRLQCWVEQARATATDSAACAEATPGTTSTCVGQE